MNTKYSRRGFSLLEVIIGLAILLIAIFSLLAVSQISLKLLSKSSHNIKAAFLLEEGIEAIKILRDSSWTTNIGSLSPGVSYYLEFSDSVWRSTTTKSYIDNIFERNFIIGNVYRNTDGDIAASGTADPNTKKVSVFVSWPERQQTITKSVSAYITNIF